VHLYQPLTHRQTYLIQKADEGTRALTQERPSQSSWAP
jgi:hypothetical protein